MSWVLLITAVHQRGLTHEYTKLTQFVFFRVVGENKDPSALKEHLDLQEGKDLLVL